MSPDRIVKATVQQVQLLPHDARIGEAVTRILEAELPALPVVEDNGKLFGIFGEREFITALFPGYLGELHSAAFVPDEIDEVIEKRLECRNEPVARYANTERVMAPRGYSDTQLAEIFLHHRVLIVPVVDEDECVVGAVTRWDFFKALAESFIARG
jgi:CBS-domain-containing membrane protein